MAKTEATLLLKIKESGAKALKDLRGKLKGLVPTMDQVKRGAAIMSAAFVAVGAAAVKFAEKSGRFDGVRKSFNALAESQGQDAKKMLDNMRELSRGTVSDMSLMEKANNALLLGLPVDRFGDMLKVAQSASVATGQSMDFMLNSIVTGLGRGSKLMLDNLGILIDTEAAYKEYAATLGKTSEKLTDAEKKQAFVNKALEVGLKNAEKTGAGALTLSQQMDVLKASWENFTVHLGEAAAPAVGFFTNKLNDLFTSITNNTTTNTLSDWAQNATKGVTIMWRLFEFVGKQLGTWLAGVGGVMHNFITGQFKKAWTNAKLLVEQTGTDIKESWDQTGADLEEIDKRYADARIARAEREKQRKVDLRKKEHEEKASIDEAAFLAEQERKIQEFEAGIDLLTANEMQKLDIAMRFLDQRIAAEKDFNAKKNLLSQKQALLERKAMLTQKQIEEERWQEKVQGTQRALGQIAGLQNSHDKRLAAIGKAAAIANITISTAQGVAKAWALGPILGPILAPLVAVAGAAQVAKVNSVKMADGGIVTPRPGGTLATIGEAGRSEAVVPLPEDFDPDEGGGIGGSGNTFIFQGPILGDKNQAREFALMLDEEFFKLRKENESIAFDQGIS